MPSEPQLRPRVFIGSSREGHGVAEAIQQNLDHACEVTIWSQGVFGLGEGTLEALVDRLDSFDFAILVLTPDDVTTSRQETHQSPRDNVLLELGMFLGAIGRQRSFIVFDRSKDLKLPSDLAGVTLANYQLHSDGNLQASLGAATSLIKASIQNNGRRLRKISAEVDNTTHFQIIHGLLDPAPEQFLIWMHENGKTIRRENHYFGGGLRYVYAVRDRSSGQGSFSMDTLCNKLPDAGLLTVDLRNEVGLTDRGHQFAQWLIDNGHRATYFRSDVGEWGQPRNDGPSWPPNWPMGIEDPLAQAAVAPDGQAAPINPQPHPKAARVVPQTQRKPRRNTSKVPAKSKKPRSK